MEASWLSQINSMVNGMEVLILVYAVPAKMTHVVNTKESRSDEIEYPQNPVLGPFAFTSATALTLAFPENKHV